MELDLFKIEDRIVFEKDHFWMESGSDSDEWGSGTDVKRPIKVGQTGFIETVYSNNELEVVLDSNNALVRVTDIFMLARQGASNHRIRHPHLLTTESTYRKALTKESPDRDDNSTESYSSGDI